MGAKFVAVEVDSGIAVDAVEFDRDLAAAPVGGSGEGFAVPADAAGEESAACSGGILGVGLTFDAPVMRQVDGAPGCIGKGGSFRAGGVSEDELPAGVSGEDEPG